MMQWPFKDWVIVILPRWKYLARLGQCPQAAVYALNQHPICGAALLQPGFTDSLTIILSYPLARFLLPILSSLGSAGPEVLVTKEGMLSPEDTTIFIELEVMTAISHSEHLMLLNQQASKGVNVLTGAIGPDHQGEIGCFYTVEVMKSMSGIQETL